MSYSLHNETLQMDSSDETGGCIYSMTSCSKIVSEYDHYEMFGFRFRSDIRIELQAPVHCMKRILCQERKAEVSEDTPLSEDTGNDPSQ